MVKNMGGNILGGNFPGGNFPGGSLLGGNFPVGSFPDTLTKIIKFLIEQISTDQNKFLNELELTNVLPIFKKKTNCQLYS